MQKLWFHFHACLDFFLTDLNFKKYRGNSACNSLQSLPIREIGGAILWHLLVGITCWFCTVVQPTHQTSTLCKCCTMNIPFQCQVVMVLISVHLIFLRKE